jgi:formylglycine-generating enzyme required for sulfatase activity
MSRPLIVLCSLIALVGCVPEIRTSPADVPDAGDLGPVLDVPVDLPGSEVSADGTLADLGDAGEPDGTTGDVQSRDVVNPMDVLSDVGSGADASTDRTLPSEAAVPADGGADARVEDRSCGVCTAANAVTSCIAGACQIDHCNAGFGDCNSRYEDGCEVTLDSVENCGRCGAACDATGLCAGGRCVTQRSCPLSGERGCGIVSTPGGSFQLGSVGATGGEPLAGQVSVSSLLVDTHEVTVARFRRFWVAGHPATTAPVHYPGGAEVPVGMVREPLNPSSGSLCNWTTSVGSREAHPVNCVDWSTAQSFCVWDGARLPTEAELEYLSRIRSIAGFPSPRRYPWGDENPIDSPMGIPRSIPCERAQFQLCAGDDGAPTRRVGSFPGGCGSRLCSLKPHDFQRFVARAGAHGRPSTRPNRR